MADAPILFTNQFTITVLDAHTQMVTYSAIPGNEPGANQNQIFVFQGMNVSWNEAEKGHSWGDPVPVSNHDQTGSLTINLKTPLENKAYVFGYSANGYINGMTAVAQIPSPSASAEKGEAITAKPMSLSVSQLATDTLILKYALPQGMNPNRYGHYIGLWEGQQLPWGQPPQTLVPVSASSASGIQVVQPGSAQDIGTDRLAGFAINSWYTIAWFTADPTGQHSKAAGMVPTLDSKPDPQYSIAAVLQFNTANATAQPTAGN